MSYLMVELLSLKASLTFSSRCSAIITGVTPYLLVTSTLQSAFSIKSLMQPTLPENAAKWSGVLLFLSIILLNPFDPNSSKFVLRNYSNNSTVVFKAFNLDI
jgi:hypothetical protein